MKHESLPAWGVWIEISRTRPSNRPSQSLPAWGVWIEMPVSSVLIVCTPSLPAWGVWIEICHITNILPCFKRHSPHGECGLKSWGKHVIAPETAVTPRMGSVD